MKKLYEVYFTLAEPASILIAANDEDEAEEIFFDQISKDEIIERIINALEMGVEVEEIEDLDEELEE